MIMPKNTSNKLKKGTTKLKEKAIKLKENNILTKEKIVKKIPTPNSKMKLIMDYIHSEKKALTGKFTDKETNKTLPYKLFRSLDHHEKDMIVRNFAELIRHHFFHNADFKTQIFRFSELFGSEKDWEHLHLFLDYIFFGPINIDLLTKLSEKIFQLIDEECQNEMSTTHITGTGLALLTEIGVKANKSLESAHDAARIKHINFIEYLTSNMLARSNVNNETMRIGLVYYFSKVEPMSKVNIQKILSRFGQSLLEHVLQIYFSHTKKSELAFYFIIEHLDNFIFSSPALAEMSNSVLQNQMFKHPQEFPLLLKKYISYKEKNINYNEARSLIIHLSFLLKATCEVNQKNLIDSILEITFNYIYTFETKSKDTLINLYDVIGEIISTSRSPKAKEITVIIYDKILTNSKMIEAVNAYKLIHLDMKNSNWIKKLKMNAAGDKKPSPLDEILLLAS